MLRLLPQWFLSSKQAVPSSVSQVNRTYFISIIFTYLVCTLLHAVLDPPRGDELSRGYIHGSFLTDFVGEPAPVPKGKMLLVDFCVLALQLLLLAAVLEKQDLKFLIVDPVLMTDTNARFGSTNLQDLDAEEQGIRRSQEGNVNEESVEEDGALDDLMTDRHFLDESYGGRMMIVTLNLSSVVSKAWRS